MEKLITRELDRQVVEQLSIDIDKLFKQIGTIAGEVSPLDRQIICLALLGNSPKEIAKIMFVGTRSDEQRVRDLLSKSIYPYLANLMDVEQDKIAGNWTRIINFLLLPVNGFKLNPPPQLNTDRFQASFGRQIFLYPPDPDIVKCQQEATVYYQQGLYYQSIHCFIAANKRELLLYGTSNPEVLIYINNCAIALQKDKLKQAKINIYTIAIVVPYYHNQGQIASEMLKGIAQLQLEVNWHIFRQLNLDKAFNLQSDVSARLANKNDIQIALLILIVNDPNNLYEPINQTATALVKLVTQENIMAVIGHYSSEMTASALAIYAQHGIPLINSSSTSEDLSNLSVGDRMAFYRLNAPDRVNAKYLIDSLAAKFSDEIAIKVALIYNQNSSYSRSYYRAVIDYLERIAPQFKLLDPYPYLSANYYQMRDYLDDIYRQEVNIIVIIADGGVEPNSMNNVCSIINRQNCWIVGSATLYQENILHWLDGEKVSTQSRIMACVPWHWDSKKYGGRSNNLMSQQFCKLGTYLWGKGNMTWRTATTFDAGWLIVNTLIKYQRQNNSAALKNSAALLEQMNRDFKQEKRVLQGVTGQISFDENSGDRLNSPTEIVAVKYDSDRHKWQWTCDPQL